METPYDRECRTAVNKTIAIVVARHVLARVLQHEAKILNTLSPQPHLEEAEAERQSLGMNILGVHFRLRPAIDHCAPAVRRVSKSCDFAVQFKLLHPRRRQVKNGVLHQV